MIQVQDFIDTIDETTQEVYKHAADSSMCCHFYQSKHPKARLSPCGYCPVLDAERRMSDQPCRLYEEDCPF